MGKQGGCANQGEKTSAELTTRSPSRHCTKSLARAYLWWPGMDRDIEFCVKDCADCQSSRKMPPVVPLHPWARPDRPWSRVHIDYAGPFEGKTFLLLIDAHSKWLEVHATNSATSAVTIELMRKTFSSLGLPDTIVSDNAAIFTSEEFAEFLKRNGIRHIRAPPYHPASNGLVERAVQTFKEGMKRSKLGTQNARLSRFLLRYRITPHSSTGSSPSELMWGRKLRSHLDLLRPDDKRKEQQAQDWQQQSHDAHSAVRQFTVEDCVYARNYSTGPMWLPGRVVGLQGTAMFRIRLGDGHTIVRHLDQLRPRVGDSSCDTTISAEGTGDEFIGDDSRALLKEPETVSEPKDSVEREPLSPAAAREPSDRVEDPGTLGDVPVPGGEQLGLPAEVNTQPPVRRSSRVSQPPMRF